MKQKNNAGFSLVEVLVAIVLLGAIVVPTCTGLVLSVRLNEKSKDMMQAQLAVSSAVETLMASGISETLAASCAVGENAVYLGVNITIEYQNPNCYTVTVADKQDLVKVTTTIRAAEGGS